MAQEIAISGGVLRPTTLGEAMEFAKLISQSAMVPQQYRGKPGDVLLAIQMGAELGLAPLQSLQNIACINGKPSIYGDAALALVKASPACEDVIEGYQGDGDGLAAVCEARRKGKQPVIVTFSVADAKRAGLWGKAGPWQSYPRRMLTMRARSWALRNAFPDVLQGLITIEEAQDYPATEPRDVTPKSALDAFAPERAAMVAAEPIEGENGAFLATAGAKADEGSEAFRGWWKTLSKSNRDRLRDDLLQLQARAEASDTAGSDDDPFLPPTAKERRDAETEPDFIDEAHAAEALQ